jgi:transposase
MRVGPRYSEQFQADAVALLVKSERTIAQVAEDLGISHQSLRNWYNASPMGKRKKRPVKVVAAEKALEQASSAETPEQRIAWLERELAAVRKRNAELEEDRAILKKAAAFFAKESE